MAIEPNGAHDVDRPSLRVEYDPIFPEIEFKGSALLPSSGKGCEGAVERRKVCRWQRTFREAIPRRLGLFIGKPCRRAHQPALELVPAFSALNTDPQMDGEAGAIDIRLQRAEIVRQCFGQHRDDAVRKIK